MIVVLTGPVRSGKTTALERRFGGDAAAAGILAPDVGGLRHLYSLRAGRAVQLEYRPGEARPGEPVAEADLTRVGRFAFFAAAFAWARGELRAALADPPRTLVVDEVGPLELRRGDGLEPLVGAVVAAYRDRPDARALLVVRDALLAEALAHYRLDAAAVVRLRP